MERKASFSVEAPKANSTQHNDRTHKPKYLLEPDPNFSGNFYKKYGEYENDKQYSEYAQDFYKKKVGQKMQKIQVPAIIKEAVISLKEEHTEKDVLQLFDKLKNEYGGHELLELAIHRDEGHFEDVDGNTFYPNTDIFHNKENGEWYFDKEFTDQADTIALTKVYNYHAHAKYTMMDNETARTHRMSKGDFMKRHQLVAKHLGLRYEPGMTRYQKKSINQVKAEHHDNKGKAKEQNKKIESLRSENFQQSIKISELEAKLEAKGKVSIKDLNELKESFRKEMIASELYYTKEDYQALTKLFNEAKEQNNKKELDLTDLRSKVEKLSEKKSKYKTKNTELQADLDKANIEIEKKDAQIASYEIKINDLEQKNSLSAQSMPEDEKTVISLDEHNQKMTLTKAKLQKKHREEVKEYREEIKELKEEVSTIKTKYNQLVSKFNALTDKFKAVTERLNIFTKGKESESEFKVYEIDGYQRVVAKSESEAFDIHKGEKITKTEEITSLKPSKDYEQRATVNGESLVKISKNLDINDFFKRNPKVKAKSLTQGRGGR